MCLWAIIFQYDAAGHEVSGEHSLGAFNSTWWTFCFNPIRNIFSTPCDRLVHHQANVFEPANLFGARALASWISPLAGGGLQFSYDVAISRLSMKCDWASVAEETNSPVQNIGTYGTATSSNRDAPFSGESLHKQIATCRRAYQHSSLPLPHIRRGRFQLLLVLTGKPLR